MDSLADDISGLDKIKDPVARLNQILKIWRDKLVAFDGRNRQLYYRKLKSGDVDFEDPYLDISALKILLSGKTVKASTLYPEIFAKIKNKKESKQIKEYVICDSDIVIRDMYVLENKDVIEIGNYLNTSPGSIAYTLEKMGIVNRRQLSNGYFDYIFSDLYEKNKKDKIIRDKNTYQEMDNLKNKSEQSKLSKDELKNIKSKISNIIKGL